MTETPRRYTAARIGYEFWAVATPSGAVEDILEGPDAETVIRALVAERNADQDDDDSFAPVNALISDASVETPDYLLDRFKIAHKPRGRKP